MFTMGLRGCWESASGGETEVDTVLSGQIALLNRVLLSRCLGISRGDIQPFVLQTATLGIVGTHTDAAKNQQFGLFKSGIGVTFVTEVRNAMGGVLATTQSPLITVP